MTLAYGFEFFFPVFVFWHLYRFASKLFICWWESLYLGRYIQTHYLALPRFHPPTVLTVKYLTTRCPPSNIQPPGFYPLIPFVPRTPKVRAFSPIYTIYIALNSLLIGSGWFLQQTKRNDTSFPMIPNIL